MVTCHMIHYHDGVSKFMLTYSVDTLPAHPRGILVCNLDPSDRPGTHWVVIYVDSCGTRAEYFDSRPISIDGANAGHTYNCRQLQSVVVYCADTTVYIFACLEVVD